MAPLPSPTRRTLLRAATLGLAGAMLPAPAEAWVQRGLAAAAAGRVDGALVQRALHAIARAGPLLWSRDIVAIVDFGLPSAAPRLHLIDILAGTTTSMRVAHGRGSDPDHSGSLEHFGDGIGSNATAEGAYLTGETYAGIHGLSRRLIGLDPSNANAEARAIVIHAAWYADAALIASQGKLGRSDGCFAVSPADIAPLLARLRRGRLLYAGRSTDPAG
jgi:hypothetical protein